MRREKTNYIIQSVSHALDVIEQFDGAPDELGVTELSKRLKLHKNNVFRLLATLEARGYIEQNKVTENYRLGVQCLQLGQHYIGQVGLVRQGRSIIEEIARSLRETALLAVLRRGVVVPLDVAESDQPVRVVSRIGEALPLHCSAAGKVHLAFCSEDDMRQLLTDPLSRFTERTITDRQMLLQQLKQIAGQGYAIDLGEHVPDARSVAAPVWDYTRSVLGCVAIAGPSHRLSEERIRAEIVPAVTKAASELSRRFGFNP